MLRGEPWELPLVTSDWSGNEDALKFFNAQANVNNDDAGLQQMREIMDGPQYTTYYEVMPDGSRRQIDHIPQGGEGYVPVESTTINPYVAPLQKPRVKSPTPGGSSWPVFSLSSPVPQINFSIPVSGAASSNSVLQPIPADDPFPIGVVVAVGAVAFLGLWLWRR